MSSSEEKCSHLTDLIRVVNAIISKYRKFQNNAEKHLSEVLASLEFLHK